MTETSWSSARLLAACVGSAGRLRPPTAPLDVLAQQIVAEVAAAGEWDEDELYGLGPRAAPYAGLERSAFDEVVDWCLGHHHRRGRRGGPPAPGWGHGRLRPRREPGWPP